MKFQYSMTKNPDDEQNRLSLEFGDVLHRSMEKAGLNPFRNPDDRKHLYLEIRPVQDGLADPAAFLEELDAFMAVVMPLMDDAIAEMLVANPQWKAKRIEKADLDDMLGRLEQRFERYTGEEPKIDESVSNSDRKEVLDEPEVSKVIHPLNQILYGPPGTGKTYQTISRSVAIIEGKSNTEIEEEEREFGRQAIRQRFRKYDEEGRISFVTFHQSFSYEDFVEGIKPMMEEGSGEVDYEISDGIFKQIATEGMFDYWVRESLSNVQDPGELHLEYDDLHGEYLDSLRRRNQQARDGFGFKTITGANMPFLRITKQKSIIVSSENGSVEYPVSKRRLEKLYNAFDSVDDISNLQRDIRDTIKGANTSSYWAVFKDFKQFESEITEGNGSTYALDMRHVLRALTTKDDDDFEPIDLEEKKKRIEGFRPEGKSEILDALPSYVLIIDEINRGNVASIFGELITLIETDKRAGMPEALTVTLPYSKRDFSVPPNLHLIGTMNTADRSVEALDTALRRRFAFVEVMPDATKVPEKVFDGDTEILVQELLTTINGRLASLLGRDHQIGHSYFMGLKKGEEQGSELRSIFRDKIIPQMQEHFYGDMGRISLVLGKSFVRNRFEGTNVRFAKENCYEEDPEMISNPVFEICLEEEWRFESIYG